MVKVAFVIGQYPGEEGKRREDVALSYAGPGVTVGIVRAEAQIAHKYGITPADLALGEPFVIEAYRRAEAEGYDAAVPLGTLDLAVDAGRCAVDIPIIAPAEAMLHIACLLGQRFGVIAYNETSLLLIRRVIARYGMTGRIAGWGISGFATPDVVRNRDAFVANFVGRARWLVEEKGAEVILPMGITQCPVFVKPDWLAAQLGVPVVEGIGAPIRLAAMMAGLGLRHSRKYWPRSPNFPPR